MAARRLHPRIAMGPGGEFDLIRGILSAVPEPRDGVLVGPGDDCALLDPGVHPLAVTVDMSVEGVHFRRDWLDPAEIGWRATAAALSDLAAAAAEPSAVLVALALPSGPDVAELARALTAGAGEAAASVGASLVGGDVTRSPGPLVVDVVALGRAPRPLLRTGAGPGDELWVTGRLGAAGAAVAAWERGARPSEPLRAAFARPVPRVAPALWLSERGAVRAGIDLSDGLAGDVGHLAAASGCAARLRAADVPVAEGVIEEAGSRGAALRLALGAGEDYELCVAAEPGRLEGLALEFEARFGIPLTRVGELTAGTGVTLVRDDGSVEPLAGAFSHFASGTV